MAESIQCYQCGTRMTLAELVKNHEDCPECGATHTISDVARALELNTRAQPPSQWSEAVEVVKVVGYLSHCTDGYDPDAPPPPPQEPLMTVAQHQRILASATRPPDQVADDLTMVKVSRELLERAVYNMELAEIDGPTCRELRALLAKP